MKLARFVFAVPLALLAAAAPRDARACGGCFVPPEESTQVTGHRMVLSVSPTETTLWDQIEYSGNPAEFAWVLPIKGKVEVGLSSDVMFAFLGDSTRVVVSPPPLSCPPPPDCYYEEDLDEAPGGYEGAGTSGGDGGVEVIAQEVVGPYETVQLSSDDPAALEAWLADHGYNLPDDIVPVVNAYVQEGFDFLALKLVPGEGVDAMRPVRVTTPGAGIGLPLRMVAAGTGAITPITLWIFGEGRYEPANFPAFTIDPKEVVWDWKASDSNYAELKAEGFEKTNGAGWLVESAIPFSKPTFESNIMNAVDFGQSGYGDEVGSNAYEEAQADLAKLFGSIDPAQLWVTRLHAELPRAALDKDLEVGASMTQTEVPRTIQCESAIGTPPPCPTYDCDGEGRAEGFFDGRFGIDNASDGDGCSLGERSGGAGPWFASIGLALAIAALRRGRARR